MNVVRTYSGRNVSLTAPDSAAIEIRDIACALSRLNRFTGATKLPVNVADHSLNVVRWLAATGASPQVQLLGLLHDAHEAYIGDITAPMRKEIASLAGFDLVTQVAERLDIAIRKAIGLGPHAQAKHLAHVHTADQAVLAAEWRDLMTGPSPITAVPASFPIKPRTADRAEEAFLRAFHRLQLDIGPATALAAS